MQAYVDFCGEFYPLPGEGVLTIGRAGDLVIDDDNPYLHRRFLEIVAHAGGLWLRNVGTELGVSVADEAGLVQTRLSPGAQVPLGSSRTSVWFTAGSTTYELEIVIESGVEGPASQPADVAGVDAEETVGRPDLTPDQRLLLVALAEDVLRRGGRGQGSIPTSASAAARLGWTLTKFNRKLDTVCGKLSRAGVRGLAGRAGRLASSRRTRLVDHAISTGLVTGADLALLDEPHPLQ
jgi:hypothetical protein